MSMGYGAVSKGAETAAAETGMFAGFSSLLSPVAAGLGLAGGLGLTDEPGTPDYSSAAGQLYGGSFSPVIVSGKSGLWVILALLAVFLIFRRRK